MELAGGEKDKIRTCGEATTDVQGEDPLSSLPDHLLVDILSLLPINSAVATDVLSQIWRGLWTRMNSISIDIHCTTNPCIFTDKEGLILGLITKVIPQLANNVTVQRFSLHLCSSPPFKFGRLLEALISRVFDQNIQEIWLQNDLCPRQRSASTIRITQFFKIHSLQGLYLGPKLYFDMSDIDNFAVNLPNLKRLHICQVNCRQVLKLLQKLTRSCASLEELVFDDEPFHSYSDGKLVVSGHNLKRLDITCSYTKVVIDAPNLQLLKLQSLSHYEASCRFVGNPKLSLLREAYIKFPACWTSCPLEVLLAISNVSLLTIYDDFSRINAFTDQFANLTQLRLGSQYFDKTHRAFLEFCPALEVLFLEFIDWLDASVSSNPVPACISQHLRRVELEIWVPPGT